MYSNVIFSNVGESHLAKCSHLAVVYNYKTEDEIESREKKMTRQHHALRCSDLNLHGLQN